MAQDTVLRDEPIVKIAGSLGVSSAQVVLRWHIQSGNVVISKSVTPERIRQNLDVADFEPSHVGMSAIAGLDPRAAPSPDTVN